MSTGKGDLHPRKIFLAGFMGAGKTTIGKVLARELGWRFIDLDDVVEEREQRSIPQLFEESEARFRQAETTALKAVIADPKEAVVGLGGGTLAQPENQRLLAAHGGPTIFLDAPLPELLVRCSNQRKARPLLQDPAIVAALFESRQASYRTASLTISTSRRKKNAVAKEILAALKAVNTQDSMP